MKTTTDSYRRRLRIIRLRTIRCLAAAAACRRNLPSVAAFKLALRSSIVVVCIRRANVKTRLLSCVGNPCSHLDVPLYLQLAGQHGHVTNNPNPNPTNLYPIPHL